MCSNRVVHLTGAASVRVDVSGKRRVQECRSAGVGGR